MPSYIAPQLGAQKEKAAVATLATPSTASDGVDITSWRTSSTLIGPTQAVVAIDSDSTTSLTSPKIYGYGPFGPAAAKQWFLIGDLNTGAAIAITAGVGYAQIIQFPNVFERLAVGATVSAGNVGYTITPIMVAE